MNETQQLLSQIVALRRRLEGELAPRRLVEGVRAEGGPSPTAEAAADEPATALERRVAYGTWSHRLLDDTIKRLGEQTGPAENPPTLPSQLTSRVRRLLCLGYEQLQQLRALADEPVLQLDGDDPLATYYRETVAMADTALRMVQAYPDAASVQLRLCDGLQATLQVVGDRLAALQAAVRKRRRENDQIERLASGLVALERGEAVDVASLHALAEEIIEEARQGEPLRFLAAPATEPARFIACHSLVVAQVVARLVRHDLDLRHRPREVVLAALVHDVGMLRLPMSLLSQEGPFSDDQRRQLETHPRLGAELVGRLGAESWLVEATANHHERLDGTGYPAGLRELQIAPLVRLLAVGDVYGALCCPRPHRPAFDPRTALTETLLLAERGTLDRLQGERLLQLSFYPVGTAVELADGSVGLVVATHMARRDLTTPARPVVALLTDGLGQPLPQPRHLDLAEVEGPAIVRSLPAAERRRLARVLLSLA
ncbi:MAG: HD domain-containing protein [Gemmataceae bacterium]|nr:HD domain-containing protein [Gemmataceae bacterium]MDW8263973.1 HD domain-containing phosphohydrolase [Gemmataceae bacterium]